MFEMELGFFNKDIDFPFFIQYGYHSGDFFQHIHKDFTELVIVLDGSATHVIGNEAYLVAKGDVFVVGSHTAHEYKDSINFKICNIMFHPDFFFKNAINIKESAGFHGLFFIEPYMTKEHDYQNRLKLNFQAYDIGVGYIENLMDEYIQKLEGWKETISAIFMIMVVWLSRKYNVPNKQEDQSIMQVANAVSFIEKNYRSQITVADIASISCLSQRHFTRIFKKAYKITPIQYVIKLRLIYGASMLRNSNASVTEIAMLCGFVDNNYFTRRFKFQYNMTPLEYRKFNLEANFFVNK